MEWDPLAGIALPTSSFSARLNGQYFRTYRLLAVLTGCYWAILGLTHGFGLGLGPIAWVRAAGCVVLWGFALATRLEKEPSGPRVEAWGLALGGLVVLVCAALMLVRQDPFLMMNFIMLGLIFGVGFRKTAMCLTALGIDLAAAIVISPLVASERRLQLLVSTTFACVLGFILHRLFATVFRRLETLDRKRALLARQRGRLVRDLRQALAAVKTLGGLIPICAGCKAIRNDLGYWEGVESFVERHSDADFTHSYCPACEARSRAEFEALLPAEVVEAGPPIPR
jgi:hypothetical protein